MLDVPDINAPSATGMNQANNPAAGGYIPTETHDHVMMEFGQTQLLSGSGAKDNQNSALSHVPGALMNHNVFAAQLAADKNNQTAQSMGVYQGPWINHGGCFRSGGGGGGANGNGAGDGGDDVANGGNAPSDSSYRGSQYLGRLLHSGLLFKRI